jgi:glucose-6-phosphate 1-dehydrogenase
MQLDLHPVEFDFDYGDSFDAELPEAYERLLLDALRGDATLFMRSDELEAAWEFVTPILDAWRASALAQIATYAAGSWGPTDAEGLIDERFGGWRRP